MKELDFNVEDERMNKNLRIIKETIENNEFSSGDGAPGSSVNTRLYLDETNNRLYIRYSDGTYKYTALT